jgi:WD40 repeat protein
MGDDSGIVFSFMFLQPRTALLRKKHNDKMNLFYWDELPNEKDFIIIKRNGRFHPECVRHLKYFDDNETLISCSKDSNSSVVIKYIGNKNKPYIFKMPKGCNCFALSRVHKVLISGSEDGTLRLWNPIITSKPVGKITGHQARIADVKIMDKSKLFMSCSSDGVIVVKNIITFKLF